MAFAQRKDGDGTMTTIMDFQRQLATLDEQVGEHEPQGEDHGWELSDLEAVLSGAFEPIIPTILKRSDGVALLYPSRLNALWGESGTGKSWVAQHTAAQVIESGGVVLYCDYEDTPRGLAGRLRALGVSDDAIRNNVLHITPQNNWNDVAKTFITEVIKDRGVLLAIIDSTGEAMALDSVKPNEDDDVARWHKRLPLFLTQKGVTVLLVDHVTKPQKIGPKNLFAIGSQRKRAAISGAVYMVESKVSPAKGRDGFLKLICAKDRHGTFQQGSIVAEVEIKSTGDTVQITLSEHLKTTRPTCLMQRISEYLSQTMLGQWASKNQIEKNVKGNAAGIRLAVECLQTEKFLEREDRIGQGGGIFYRSMRPFSDNST